MREMTLVASSALAPPSPPGRKASVLPDKRPFYHERVLGSTSPSPHREGVRLSSILVPRAAVVVTAFLLVFAACLAASGPADATERLTKAPDFRAVDLAGERFALDDLLGRGPIVVNFWKTGSKPCVKGLPHIQRLQDEYEDAGVQVLAVNVDSPQTQSQARRFVKSQNFDLRVVTDAEQDVFRKLQGKGALPYAVVLDEDGNIRHHQTGYRPGDEKELARVVEELLEEAKREEGRRLYTSHCQLCHGPAGQGDGPLARQQDLIPADLAISVGSHGDTDLRKTIAGEDHHRTSGSTMPYWGSVFTGEQIDALVAYLRLLGTSKHEPRDNPKTGTGLYQQYCRSCHGERGRGDGVMTDLVAMEPMDHTDPVEMDRLSNEDLVDRILNGAGEYMPAWRGILSRSEVEQLIGYIRRLAR